MSWRSNLAPVRRPFATSIHDIHEFLRNHTIGLLAWVQRVEPQEAIRARVPHTVAAGCVALVDDARNVQRRRPVQILRRVVVDVRQLAPCISIQRLGQLRARQLTKPCTLYTAKWAPANRFFTSTSTGVRYS